MNAHFRKTSQLTLGFLTIDAYAAPLDVVIASAANGYGACGLRVSGRNAGDSWPSVDNNPSAFSSIRHVAAQKGIRISSISGFYITPQTTLAHMLENVRAARELGVHLICQGCFEADHNRVAALLKDYADAAGEAGIRIAIEFMPMSELKTLNQTLEMVDRAGVSNVGLLIDSLHLARSGSHAADVAALDPKTIYLTQLCDGPAKLATDSTLFDEAMTGRMYLGDGRLELADLVRALPSDAEIELETPVVADTGLTSVERASRAANAAQRFFSAHFGIDSYP